MSKHRQIITHLEQRMKSVENFLAAIQPVVFGERSIAHMIPRTLHPQWSMEVGASWHAVASLQTVLEFQMEWKETGTEQCTATCERGISSHPPRNGIWGEQDNDPKYTAKITRDWFLEEKMASLSSWFYLWRIMKLQVHQRESHIRSFAKSQNWTPMLRLPAAVI